MTDTDSASPAAAEPLAPAQPTNAGHWGPGSLGWTDDGPPASVRLAGDTARDVLDAAEPDPGEAIRAEVRAETAPGSDGGTPAGWYPEPGGEPGTHRYWDGGQWLGQAVPLTETPLKGEPEEPVPPDALKVALGDSGLHVYVLPRRRWKSSALGALNGGRFDDWAEECLVRDVDYEAWLELDPTIEQVEDFFAAYAEASGSGAGKSPQSRRSLMRGRRR